MLSFAFVEYLIDYIKQEAEEKRELTPDMVYEAIDLFNSEIWPHIKK